MVIGACIPYIIGVSLALILFPIKVISELTGRDCGSYTLKKWTRICLTFYCGVWPARFWPWRTEEFNNFILLLGTFGPIFSGLIIGLIIAWICPVPCVYCNTYYLCLFFVVFGGSWIVGCGSMYFFNPEITLQRNA